MKKKLLKSLALALSIMPMTRLYAMNEQPSNHNNQSYTQRAWNYARNLDLKSIALYETGWALAILTGTAAHELGHAAMAEAIKPGSVKHIEILSTTPRVRVNIGNMSPAQMIAISVAGPIAGALGSYAAVKVLQLICAYQKTGNFKTAVKGMLDTPISASPSKKPFIEGLYSGFITDIFVNNALQMFIRKHSDGQHALASALYGYREHPIPGPVAIACNIALLAVLYLAMEYSLTRSTLSSNGI